MSELLTVSSKISFASLVELLEPIQSDWLKASVHYPELDFEFSIEQEVVPDGTEGVYQKCKPGDHRTLIFSNENEYHRQVFVRVDGQWQREESPVGHTS